MLPTIADVLALPAVAAGLPEVLTGTDALERRVRWVHVAPPSGGRRLLLGGELLLATGVGWPSEPTAPPRDGRPPPGWSASWQPHRSPAWCSSSATGTTTRPATWSPPARPPACRWSCS